MQLLIGYGQVPTIMPEASNIIRKEIRQHKSNSIRQLIFTYLIHIKKDFSSIDTRFFTASLLMNRNDIAKAIAED